MLIESRKPKAEDNHEQVVFYDKQGEGKNNSKSSVY